MTRDTVSVPPDGGAQGRRRGGVLNRRRFLQLGGMTAAGLVLPHTRAGDAAPAAPPSLFCNLEGNRTLAASPPVTPYTVALPIPPVAQPVRSDDTTDYYELTMREATATVLPGKQTTIRGYEGRWPGPTIRARVGRGVSVVHHNDLDVETAIHLHGGHVPPEMDGHPIDAIPAGQSREYRHPNAQRTSTLWYHDHVMHLAPENVYR